VANEKVTDRAREIVSDAAADLGAVVEDGLDEAREKFESAASDFERRARHTRRELRRRAEEVGDAARERYDAAVDGLQRGYRKVRKDASALADDVGTYVKENPGTAIAIAAGAGFLLGMLVRGRRREEI
jgi:ElaB/YqjD/DUF883 family membrane-anchored ribosome-binding protein